MAKVLKMERQVPDTWQDALQDFIYWKQAQGVSDTTIEDYQKHVKQFFTRYPQAYRNEKQLKKGLLEYMVQKVKPATFNLRLVYLKAFLNWGIEEGVFSYNPLSSFKRRKDEGRVCDLDVETLQRLVNLPDRDTFAGLRDYALILLTLDTGIRPKEAFSLLESDISLRGLVVVVRAENSKTRVGRSLPILPATAKAIKDVLSVRHTGWKDTVPVFCTADGTPLNASTWGDRIELYSKKLGVKIRPYDLRHSFALLYLRNGGHAFGLQRTMGHTTLHMTKRYVNLSESDLKEQHDSASPLNTLGSEEAETEKDLSFLQKVALSTLYFASVNVLNCRRVIKITSVVLEK